jgi:hypothetical protein
LLIGKFLARALTFTLVCNVCASPLTGPAIMPKRVRRSKWKARIRGDVGRVV